MAKGILETSGTILAIVGVVICPITSGDTALRSCRLIVGESLKKDQKLIKNRLLLIIPIFIVIIGIIITGLLSSLYIYKLFKNDDPKKE